MEIVKFEDGNYSYVSDGESGNVIQGTKADEIVNDPTCVLYSPMITTYNLGTQTEKWMTSLYDNRVCICSRGSKWSEEFCIEVDKIFYICGAGFEYRPWHNEWEKRQLSPNEFIQYLNLIEQNGISYVRDMYLDLLKQELNELRNTKCLGGDIHEQLKGIKEVLQKQGCEREVEYNLSKSISYLREAQEKILLLTAEIAKVEEHRRLY